MTVNHWVPGSSPGRGANFKASDDCPGLFCITRTLARDAVSGYSAHSASRSRAEARSAAQSSPGRGAKSKPQTIVWGFFVSPGLSPGTLSQVIRLTQLHGAAPKRVLLRSRVQVAEPTSKPQTIVWGFLVSTGLSQGRCPRLFASLPLQGGAEARSAGRPYTPRSRPQSIRGFCPQRTVMRYENSLQEPTCWRTELNACFATA